MKEEHTNLKMVFVGKPAEETLVRNVGQEAKKAKKKERAETSHAVMPCPHLYVQSGKRFPQATTRLRHFGHHRLWPLLSASMSSSPSERGVRETPARCHEGIGESSFVLCTESVS